MRRAYLLSFSLLAFSLSACSQADEANVGALSPDEESQLNNAAEMLDASADDLALPPEGQNSAGNTAN